MTPMLLAFVLAAAPVQVVDRAGKPIPGAKAVCVDPGPGAEPCRKVRCEAEGWIAVETAVGRGKPSCTLKPAVRVGVEVPGTIAGKLEVRLHAAGSKEPTAHRPLAAPKEGEAGPARAPFDPLPAGRYAVELARATDGWACRADVGPLGPGSARVVAGWREPRAIVGKLVDGEGKPAPGKTIGVKQDDAPAPGRWFCRFAAEVPVKTDAAGAFRVPVDPASDTLVTAGALDDPDGFAWRTVRGIPSTPLTLKLEKPVRFVAKLVDDQERPAACRYRFTLGTGDSALQLPGVESAQKEAACDAEGRLAAGPVPAAPWALAVKPDRGLVMRLSGGAPAGGETRDLGTLRVERGGSLRVEVVDRDDRPIAGAAVVATGSAGVLLQVEAKTDGDGRADLAGLPPRGRLHLRVSRDGFAPHVESGAFEEGETRRVRLTPASRIEGVVEDDRGEPVSGATVRAVGDEGVIASSQATGSDGGFVVESVPAGKIQLGAEAEGYGSSSPKKLEVKEGVDVRDVVLVLEPAPTLRGTVVDPDGAPVDGARVRLGEAFGLGEASRPARVETRSGSDGRFELRGRPVVQEELVALAAGFGPARERAPHARGAEEITLRLTPAASVVVNLVGDRWDGRSVAVKDGAGVERRRAVAGERRLEFRDLAPGAGEVEATDAVAKSVALVAGTTVEVSLGTGAVVEGHVTASGRPVSRGTVTAVGKSERGWGATGTERLDADGSFRFAEVPAGEFTLVAIAAEGRSERRVTVPESGTVVADLEIRNAIAIVRVTDASSQRPVPSAWVDFQPEGGTCNARTMMTSWPTAWEPGVEFSASDGGCDFGSTGSDGVAVVRMGATGRHRLEVRKNGYETVQRDVTLEPGETVLDVPLKSQGGQKVRIAFETDPPGMQAAIACGFPGRGYNSWSWFTTPVDCEWDEVAPDFATVRVDGYGFGWAPIAATKGEDTSVTVQVRRGGRIVVPSPAGSPSPLLDDGSGGPWERILQSVQQMVRREELPEVGPAWVIEGVPPGRYAVSVGGAPRGVVEVTPGGTAVAR